MRTAGKRLLFGIIGLIATALGIAGVWLPGLPTTVFILIALWAFSKSSDRLHRWLTRIPLLAPAIKEAERFSRERTLDFRVKLVSQGCAWLSFVVVTLLSRQLLISIILGLLAVFCSIFMWRVPTKERLATESDRETRPL